MFEKKNLLGIALLTPAVVAGVAVGTVVLGVAGVYMVKKKWKREGYLLGKKERSCQYVITGEKLIELENGAPFILKGNAPNFTETMELQELKKRILEKNKDVEIIIKPFFNETYIELGKA